MQKNTVNPFGNIKDVLELWGSGRWRVNVLDKPIFLTIFVGLPVGLLFTNIEPLSISLMVLLISLMLMLIDVYFFWG